MDIGGISVSQAHLVFELYFSLLPYNDELLTKKPFENIVRKGANAGN